MPQQSFTNPNLTNGWSLNARQTSFPKQGLAGPRLFTNAEILVRIF